MRSTRRFLAGLLVVGLLSVIVIVQGSRVQISFGDSHFSAIPERLTHWGPLPGVIISQMPVSNAGWLPLWYREVHSESGSSRFALGILGTTSEVVTDSPDIKIRWKRLESGGTVEVREYGFGQNDHLGIEVMDWMGRRHTIRNHDLDLAPIWRDRAELPLPNKL